VRPHRSNEAERSSLHPKLPTGGCENLSAIENESESDFCGARKLVSAINLFDGKKWVQNRGVRRKRMRSKFVFRLVFFHEGFSDIPAKIRRITIA
jgi:hypothetical protein